MRPLKRGRGRFAGSTVAVADVDPGISLLLTGTLMCATFADDEEDEAAATSVLVGDLSGGTANDGTGLLVPFDCNRPEGKCKWQAARRI